MLSRVAERTYWLARYLERAENTARLIKVYSALLLDLPTATGLGWETVLQIVGSGDQSQASEFRQDEQTMLKFLLFDATNPNALLNCLEQSRENARTTRDLLPTEGWRAVNELCLFARAKLPKAAQARQRVAVMEKIIEDVQAITGLLSGTMSQGTAYQFVRLGRNLERADMTTRMIDFAVALLMTGRPELQRYDNTLWMAVLRCLSAYQMYRQHVRRRVQGEDVIHFLLQDADFPRSVTHCVGELTASLDRLPRAAEALRPVARMSEQLATLEVATLDNAGLHQLVDEFQLELAGINDVIAMTWFHPDSAL